MVQEATIKVQVEGLPEVKQRIAAMAAEVSALRAAVERVRALHSPEDRGLGPYCKGCATHITCTDWPCPTITALDGAAAGGERVSRESAAKAGRRSLTVMEAHLAADCPDRATCWAADIHDRYDRDTTYCGCCGDGPIRLNLWCDRCAAHVGQPGPPPWERTYQAISGEPCPFQVGGPDA